MSNGKPFSRPISAKSFVHLLHLQEDADAAYRRYVRSDDVLDSESESFKAWRAALEKLSHAAANLAMGKSIDENGELTHEQK